MSSDVLFEDGHYVPASMVDAVAVINSKNCSSEIYTNKSVTLCILVSSFTYGPQNQDLGLDGV